MSTPVSFTSAVLDRGVLAQLRPTVLRVDHADGSGLRTHHQALRARAVAPIANAAKEFAVGDAGSREEHVVAGHEVVEVQHLVDVVAKVLGSLAFVVIARPKASLDRAAEALQRARRGNTL